MKDKKFQIFVSSTYSDLKEERQAAVEAILSSGHIPAGMELFSAGDESQMTVIKRWIDESDIYLLILGGRYGSIETKSGKSFTQLEYEYALTQKKPLFSVVISESALDEKTRTMGRSAFEDKNPQLLNDFKSLVLSNLVKFWDDKKDIKIAIHETISDFAYRKDLIGWVRGNNTVDIVPMAEEITRLTKENHELREKLKSNSPNEIYYGGLSFMKLTELLLSEKLSPKNENENLINFFLGIGDKLAKGVNKFSDDLDLLVKYKLIKDVGGDSSYRFVFTEDGHNFFLNALYKSKEQKSSV